MACSVKNAVYKAFGLNLLSPIALPELPQVNEKEEQADVIIEMANLSKFWSESVPPHKRSVVAKDMYMFQISNVAIFCVRAGKQIIVSPIEGFDEDYLRLFILGTCMGAVLMQRKILPLHGSALAINGKAYGIIGESGAGKSTLASALLSEGYQLLSDDVIAVTLSEDSKALITPSYPQQKLWQESIHQLGMETGNYQPLFKRETKYAVPVSSKFFSDPLPLAGIFELVKTDHDTIDLRRMKSLEQLPILFFHTYRKSLIKRFGLLNWHFKITAAIANQIDLFRLQRPVSGFTARRLASFILNTVNGEG